MRQPRATANRTVLTTAGLILLTGGTWLATAGTSLTDRLPTWWPTVSEGDVLLNREDLAQLRDHAWWTATVSAAGIIITVLLVLWFLSQLHIRTRSRLPLTAPGSELHTRALKDALTRRVTAVNGVARCHLHIHSRRRHLHVRMRVWLAPDTAPGHVLERIHAVTAEAEQAATPYTLEARVRLSHENHPAPHVR
ncbi:hypothetical protein [Streptomyces beijiangensis]|uniref:Alkaline shock response membrane anchor protein AmaP n=1 Tax=Streptomyces beijiangensis TaxID=163361 RepID=A0A939FF97_9ACTN|nr:hypothetical protein [Streptomyces beijiangensis]MBO0517618.1 hypothetical protein [Streptomyces beijiangensis]